MKNPLTTYSFWLLTGFMFIFLPPVAQACVGPEAKRDLLMEVRFTRSLEALREPDDRKTLASLHAMASEYIAAIQMLKPAYEAWFRGLSVDEKRQLVNGMSAKKWLLIMRQIQFDEQISRRFRDNLALGRAYEQIQFLCNRASEYRLL